MARSVSTSSDDSLSADSYLNVLYVPSFNKPDRSRCSSEESADSHQTVNTQINGDESPPHSHLDETRYEECVYYLQEVRQWPVPRVGSKFLFISYHIVWLRFFPGVSIK
jgi:zinc finger FYVE domain-containing protein 26